MTAPTPRILAHLTRKPSANIAVLPEPRLLAAVIDPNEHGKRVRPGLVSEEFFTAHDGIVKAKHLVPGMVVQAWLHGMAKGGERVVGTVTRMDDGATIEIWWASNHVTSQVKPAYRYFVQALAGTPVSHIRQIAAFVEA